MALDRKALWRYSHSASIFFAVLLFTASFLCVLLWTNNIVENQSSVSTDPVSNTFTGLSPPVQTFSITYRVAIFGTIWNSILFVTLAILERDVIPLGTVRLRYEVEKAACIVAVVGNAIYSVALIALLCTLAKLAADSDKVSPLLPATTQAQLHASAGDRAAGQGATAAMAGLAAFSAVWSCVMDALHAQDSQYRRVVKEDPIGNGDEEKTD